MDLKYRIFLFVSTILVGLGLLFIFQSQNSDKTRLIFCDVGQGDGMLIVSGTKQVVIDGGPGNKILDCLGAKMPFWDREIEMVVLTHPQKDHMEGLIALLARYGVKTVVTTGIGSETQLFKGWEEAVKSEGAIVRVPDVGDQFLISRGPTPEGVKPLKLSVLWPPNARAAEWQADPPSDLNETAIVMRLEWGPTTGSGSMTCVYLTGDLPKELLEPLIDRPCDILKVAHHGSKTGTSQEALDKIKPKLAVIQAGKNSYGHPTKEVLDVLAAAGVRVLRNDLNGEIEVVSNGKGFSVKSER